MLQRVFFTSIDGHNLPCTGLFCSRFGRHLLPGTHIIFKDQNNGGTSVGRILSCDDRVNALINKYDYHSNWNPSFSTPALTDSWTLGLE